MGDVILSIDDLSSISHCRICHEEEFESLKSLEAPCACSGSFKFAHRDCVQRWCSEKGNTTCEICLQKYEPGYTVMAQSQLIEAALTIGEGLQIPRREVEPQHQATSDENEFSQCASAAERGASCCRSAALTFTVVLLVKHLFAVINSEADHYPFALPMILLLRATGILLPMYVVIRSITAIRNIIRRRRRQQGSEEITISEDEGDD